VEDRRSSKRTVKQLLYGCDAPDTRYHQELWTNRFNAFRTITLQKSTDQRFAGDDLIRFLDCSIDKIRPQLSSKPVCNPDTFPGAVNTLLDYGIFTYSEVNTGFRFIKHDGAWIQTFFDNAVKDGRLIEGRWNKRVWLNFMMLAHMSEKWLEHHQMVGTNSWDVIIARLRSVVLNSSLGCRVGDVARSAHYTGEEYIKYSDIQLQLDEGDEPSFALLHRKFTLELFKGLKDRGNVDVP